MGNIKWYREIFKTVKTSVSQRIIGVIRFFFGQRIKKKEKFNIIFFRVSRVSLFERPPTPTMVCEIVDTL